MSTEPGPARRASLFAPLFLLALSLLAMNGFQTWQLLQQQARLQDLRETQEPAMEDTRRVREQLQALTQGTANLAAAGNQNAQRIIDELARQGVKVTATEAPPSTP